MGSEVDHKRRNGGRTWIWLLLLVVLLGIVKLLFLGTYYIGEAESNLPNGIPSKSILFVALQGTPQSSGDILLVELDQKSLTPAKYQHRDDDSLYVEIGRKTFSISDNQVRGRVIGVIKL